VIVVFCLLAVWAGMKSFRGAAVIAPRHGETPEEAEARTAKVTWRILVPLIVLTGLAFYAFVVRTTVQ
jgi:hypothetical protein